MRVRHVLAAAVVSAGLAAPLAVSVAFAAGPASKPAEADIAKTKGGTWASIATLPNMSGVWETYRPPRPAGAAPTPRRPPEELPLTPEYAAKAAAFKKGEAEKLAKGETPDVDSANCVPPGLPDVMTQPYPMELLFTPGKVTIVIEAYSQTRRIFLDGRKHPEDPDLTYNCHSIGHWEGDALVVDSVGFTPDTALGPGQGYRHSDQMHIVERFRLTAPDTMEVVTTIDDPKALTKPFSSTKVLKRHRDWDIAEYICEQNNRNLTNENGKAGIILKH